MSDPQLIGNAEIARRLGVQTAGSAARIVKRAGLTPASTGAGRTQLYTSDDIDRLVASRPIPGSPSPKRPSGQSPTEKANAKMLDELAKSEGTTRSGKAKGAKLDPAERACIYSAWLEDRLGPHSPWLHAEPPSSYKSAYAAREAAYADAEPVAA